MYFLGQAGNYTAADTRRHLFACGTAKDSADLKNHLAHRYSVPTKNVILYNNGRSALAAGLKTAIERAELQATLHERMFPATSWSPGSEPPVKTGGRAGAREELPAAQPAKAAQPTGVIITSLTCYAVVEAVKAAGCTPIFADATERTLHFDLKTLEKAYNIHPEAQAIIVQNNLGIPIDIVKIEEFAKAHDLILVEDLAHCTGISYPDGREVGTVGDIVALSFGKGKSIDTITGGALIVRNKSFKVPSQPEKAPSAASTFHARIYPLLAAIIRGNYRFNPSGRNLGRALTAAFLKLHLIERSADAKLDLDTRLSHWQAKLALAQLKALPKNRPPIREFYLIEHREKALKELERAGFVLYDTWYDCPVSPQRYYQKSGFKESECPTAVRLARQIINLPTHYGKAAMEPARKIISQYNIHHKSIKGEEK